MKPETKLRANIVKKLKENGWFVMSWSDKWMSGVPDLICIKKGRYIFIEIKKPTGKVEKIQEFTHNQLRSVGCQVEVVRSVEDLETILK